VIKDINEIPPEIFVKSVLAATHKAYSGDRTKIKHTKSVKLVLKVAEKCGYNQLGHGFYKHGHFSFRVFELMNMAFTYQSLHGLKRDQTLNWELIDFVTPIVIELSDHFLDNFNRFIKHAHTIDAPPEFIALYACGERFERALKKATKQNKKELKISYDLLEGKISELDACLKHVPKERIDTYFKFTELLEGVLLVCKYRDFNAIIGKNIIDDLFHLYKENVSFLLYPYIETLSGGDIEYEKERYNSTMDNKISWSSKRLNEIERMIIKFQFKPTIEELDKEITREFNSMSKKEKNSLINLLVPSE